MDRAEFLAAYQTHPLIEEITEQLSHDIGRSIQLRSSTGSLNALLIAGLHQRLDRHQLVLLSDKEEAAYFLNDLEALLGDSEVLFFPGSYRRPYEIEETDNANVLLRAEVLNKLTHRRKPIIVVTYPEGMVEKVVTKKELVRNSLKIKQGDLLDLDFLNETLFDYHFERVDFVTEPGQFSVRGGILDVFSFSNEEPFRIEFFDNEIESIRTFDIETQVSEKKVREFSLIPNVSDKMLIEAKGSFLEFLSAKTLVWTRELNRSLDKIDGHFEKAQDIYEALETRTAHLSPERLFENSNSLKGQLSSFDRIEFGTGQISADLVMEVESSPQPSFQKHFELLVSDLRERSQAGYHNIILCSSAKQVERFHAIFEDIGADVDFHPILMNIHEGFIDHRLKLTVYTDHQIFERYQKFRLKTGFEKKQRISLKELTQLEIGDYVAHIDHGIGVFGGLQKIDVNGKTQEAIKLTYKDNDILYVSIHSLHKISRYNGKEGAVPKINKLGSANWSKLKQKAKTRVKKIAYDLIQLYAKRKGLHGFSFAPDSYLQHELEASFIFEDTPDQIKTTQEVKSDMESEFPMDRLICGDVGFGKTEIAVRAAFKAVDNGKQVAVLVPTTILAFQHYRTFSERMKDLPVRVDYLNRFKSQKNTTAAKKDLADGKIDILIGTHRIVSKDVQWKDLGLLVIDEEQKFGVAVKDKLKTLRENIDTLTLTATPIPRTLQFSLMGARDLSVIQTPPPNRYPVETEVHGFNEEMIRDAITYEVSRRGQVFFIHNRIENIQEVAGMVQRLCPGVKVGIGHGQMDGKKLEKLLLGFMEGEFDVLISTTIIESGLDIPNANTMIINNGHMFGLSDLHQMRGRVGRSNKKAFCYLLAPPTSSLTDEARKRLRAIEQFSELGSGFSIAMRDLEIRGAGDLLGAEQSGFINDIGFDTYQKILKEAMDELKEKEFKDLYKEEKESIDWRAECQIVTDLELLIPDTYVNQIAERLQLYRELDNLNTEQELDGFKKRMLDRFGPLPEQVEHLLRSLRLRWLAEGLGMTKLVLKNETMLTYFIEDQESPFFQSPEFSYILNYLKHHFREVHMKEKNGKLMLRFDKVSSVEQALEIFREIKGD
jgi:transcription-repair coupling factor (superfamily II helicase)